MLKNLFIYAATAIIASVTTMVVFAHEPATIRASQAPIGPPGAPAEMSAEHLVYSSQMSPETLVFSEEFYSD